MTRFYKLFFTFLIVIVNFCFLSGQNKNNSDLNFEKIEKKIDSLHDQPEKIWKLIRFYIKKSKADNNLETLLYAYRYASNFSEYPKNIKYADSALIVGKKSQNKRLLTDAYLNHGIVNMYSSFPERALDDILIANKYATEIGDEYIINKSVYLIAQNKIFLGLYEEANEELRKCIVYFKNNLNNNSDSTLGKNNQMYYIYSLMSYIDSNTKLGKLDQNKPLLKEAFDYLNKNNLKQYKPYFISCEGVDAYYRKDYLTSISKLSEAIRLYNDPWPHITEIYYLGLSNWKIGKRSLAVKYLEEIDKQFNKTNKLEPQFRSAYELLIKYNDSIGNRDKQLEYINKLMGLDKSYEKNYKYLYTKINKEYDTQKLIAEKNRIENSLQTQKIILTALLIGSILLLSLIIFRYKKLQETYKKRFDEIIAEKKESPPIIKEVELEHPKEIQVFEGKSNDFDLAFYDKIPGLNPLFVEDILNKLNEFEKIQGFLDTQISQKQMSENFGTNPTYLSRIINVYKGKNFNHYINDLKLDYLIEYLKTDTRYLNMDVKEWAKLAGFTNTENFSDHFQRKFQIKPSFFMKMMKENIKTSAQ